MSISPVSGLHRRCHRVARQSYEQADRGLKDSGQETCSGAAAAPSATGVAVWRFGCTVARPFANIVNIDVLGGLLMSGVADRDSTLLRDVRIFDGHSERLSGPTNVLVSGNTITSISPVVAAPVNGGQRSVIDCGGRVLVPGLIDAHAHTAFSTLPLAVALGADPTYLGITGAVAARDTLLRGFTTVRDAGGPVFGLKAAIDEGW